MSIETKQAIEALMKVKEKCEEQVRILPEWKDEELEDNAEAIKKIEELVDFLEYLG